MKASTSRSRASGWLYAGYLLAVVAIALLGAGSLAALRMREQASALFEITGPLLSFEPDPVDGPQLAPHGATRIRMLQQDMDFEVYTDSRGFRVGAPGMETPDSVDLLLVGDSFFFGWGVRYDESTPALLAARTGLRLASAAVPASNTVGATFQIERQRDLRPKWIAYDIIDLHLERNVCPCVLNTVTPLCDGQYHVAFDAQEAPYFHDPVASFFAPRHGSQQAFQAILREQVALSSAYWALRVVAGGLYRKWFYPCTPDPERQEKATRYALQRLSAASRAANAQLLVLYVPDLAGAAPAEGRLLPSLLRDYAQDFTLVDMTPDVNAHFANPFTAAPLQLASDYHPNAAGHELMARALCRALQERAHLAPDACAESPGGSAE